jgi:hypothetical protein
MTEKLTDKEKKISSIAIWVWRNLLASGIILVCFGFLYNKCEQIEDNVIEVRTVLKERIRLDRGDYGYAEPVRSLPNMTDDQYDKMLQDGSKVRQHVNDFANENSQ